MLIWRKSIPKPRWKAIAPDEDLFSRLGSFDGTKDSFITVNEFRGWRRVALLVRLRACFVDIDNCRTLEAALLRVSDAHIPAPSYAVMSGNGVHLYWWLEPAPAKALPVWQAVQQQLVAKLDADAAAKDCARILRLVGTVNSKNGRKAEGVELSGVRWTMHELADEVIGPRPTQEKPLGSIAHRKATRRAIRSATASLDLWFRRWNDLNTIAEHFVRTSPTAVPEGHRDKLLFLLANALSWFRPAAGLASEIEQIAAVFVPTLSKREVAEYTKPIVKRATEAASGRKSIFGDEERDPRYAFKTETIRAWLGDLIVPEVEGRLTVLLPPDRLKLREEARQRSRDRVAEGRYTRSRASERAGRALRAGEAQQMKAAGQTVSQITEQLGVSRAEVYRLLKADFSSASRATEVSP